MEYVQGKTLGSLIAHKGGLPLSTNLRCAIQIVEAIGKAHVAGIFHRDLKPSNVMVNDGGFQEEMVLRIARLAAVRYHAKPLRRRSCNCRVQPE